MIVLFWIFIAIILLLQLLAVDEYDFRKALMYSTVITGTFAIYVHFVLRRIIGSYMDNRRLPVLILRLLLVGGLASAVLTVEDYAMDSFFQQDWNRYRDSLLPRFLGMLLASILISGIAYAFELYRHHIKMLEASQDLKDRLNELELKSIRQQLSPHFTFNVLNNLQFLMQRDRDKALTLLAQYSKVLRYYVYESQHKAIFLDDEVSFLKTYLELEKDRLGDEAKIEMDIAVAPNELKIVPFILSTFVENCFKHLSMKDRWISVLIHFKNNNLHLLVQNTYDNKPEGATIHEGIGLEQVKKRLELTYPGRYELMLGANEHIFKADLKIKYDDY